MTNKDESLEIHWEFGKDGLFTVSIALGGAEVIIEQEEDAAHDAAVLIASMPDVLDAVMRDIEEKNR